MSCNDDVKVVEVEVLILIQEKVQMMMMMMMMKTMKTIQEEVRMMMMMMMMMAAAGVRDKICASGWRQRNGDATGGGGCLTAGISSSAILQ